MSELTDIIKAEIAVHGSIAFAKFMEMALYFPELGYYETDHNQVGFQGDFYTSVSTGELFGQLLAFRIATWLTELPPESTDLRIMEAGAHDAKLALDILSWLRQHRPELSARLQYWIIEPSLRRQQWQKQKLLDFATQIRWLDQFPTAKINGVILSNELLDAMPVHRFGWDAASHQWFEWGVTWEDDKFCWSKMAISANHQSAFQFPEELLQVLPDDYTFETCPAAEKWWSEAAKILERGWLMTLDYGFTTEEMINPGRTKGTVRAYYRHQINDHLLANTGGQDLTAHVNFSAIQAVGENAGLKTEGYLTQPQFLTKILAEGFKDAAFREWTASRTRQFQTLTHPQHMGRAFKVLVQSRMKL